MTRLGAAGEPLWSFTVPYGDHEESRVLSYPGGLLVVGRVTDVGIDFDPGSAMDVQAGPGTFISRFEY